MSEEEILCVHVPELRLALPQGLVNQIGKVQSQVSLVLAIPVDLSRCTNGQEQKFIGMRMQELDVHWRVNVIPAAIEEGINIKRIPFSEDTEKDETPKEEDVVPATQPIDTSSDTVMLSDSDPDMQQSQSIL